jgi:hypothetical protein
MIGTKGKWPSEGGGSRPTEGGLSTAMNWRGKIINLGMKSVHDMN